MEPSGSLPFAGTAWTTGDGGCCPRGCQKGLGEKHLSDADRLWWGGIRLPRVTVVTLAGWKLSCD